MGTAAVVGDVIGCWVGKPGVNDGDELERAKVGALVPAWQLEDGWRDGRDED